MEKSLKTFEIMDAYRLLGNAKYHKLEDPDKIRVWKISRMLKPVAMQADEAQQDATRTMVPDSFREQVIRAEEYKKARMAGIKDKLPMTDREYLVYLADFNKYNALVAKAVEETFQKEVRLEFEPISEEAMGLLVACNDWPLSQVERLEWMIG